MFWLTGWLLRYKKPRLSQFRSSVSAIAQFILKGMILPLCAANIFGWLYFNGHDQAFSLKAYWSGVLPVVTAGLFIILGVEISLYTFEAVVVVIRAYRIRKAQMPDNHVTVLSEPVEDHASDSSTLTSDTLLKVTRNRIVYEMTLADFYIFDIVRKRVKGFDRNADDYNFNFRAMKSIKDVLVNDPRFFCTSSFIMRHSTIDRVEKDGFRNRIVYFKAPFSGMTKVNKTYAKAFDYWYSTYENVEKGKIT
ncbi:hypothetical protein GCM10011418_15650 [Sphingobacterium alkalisoli]|nr:hypothetical protein GCM10011418_15650 [Sphingobacterium alkalisoli]